VESSPSGIYLCTVTCINQMIALQATVRLKLLLFDLLCGLRACALRFCQLFFTRTRRRSLSFFLDSGGFDVLGVCFFFVLGGARLPRLGLRKRRGGV
jgi:hypothetical protein